MGNPVKKGEQATELHAPPRIRAAVDDSADARREVVMLLDNHHGPDPRVAFELELLREAGVPTTVIAWDRRSERRATESPRDVVRIRVPAPPGGGRRSLVASWRFGARVWRERRRLLGRAALLIVHDVYLLPLGWTLSRLLNKPFIYDAHEEYARMEAGRYPPWALRFVTAVETRLARGALAVVVPGASRTPRWRGVLARPPIVLPNLVRRDRPARGDVAIEWDLVYVGTVSEGRRLDILVELARVRPDLRIGIAGRGRSVEYLTRAAEKLPNLHFLGWRSDADELLAAARAIYYGLDPKHPYSDAACPNTLYQALIHRKPLIFFCAGEPAALAREFRIGLRCEASPGALSAAVDRVATTTGWQFDEAWEAVWQRAEAESFVEAVKTPLRQSA